MLVVFLPLTLASQTQHRLKVNVHVFGDNNHINNILESNLKRELRLLGDIDIVEVDENWRFTLQVNYLENTYKDGTKTGWLTLASVLNERIPDFYFQAHWLEILKRHPVYPSSPVPAFYPKDDLDKYCVVAIGNIDKNNFVLARKLLR